MRSTKPYLLGICLFVALGCAVKSDGSLEANKEVVRRFTAFVNAADWEALGTVVAEDFHRHSAATAGPPVTSRDAFVQLQETFLASFPDQEVVVDILVAESDYVAALATYSGTLSGPMGDIPATGKSASLPFLALFRLEAGRIQEMWVEWDNLAMLGQLGLAPPAPPADPANAPNP